jgi:hypothetical protein
LLLCGCGNEDTYVLSGYPPVIISPVHSALHAQMNFKDTGGGAPHPQWVIVLTDASDVCTKLATHADYFVNPIEGFNAVILWQPPGLVGTWFVGQGDGKGSVAGCEVLAGHPQSDGGTGNPVVRLNGVPGGGATISTTQFNVGAGGQAIGSFDIGVADPLGIPREFAGKFKTNYCVAMESATLP